MATSRLRMHICFARSVMARKATAMVVSSKAEKSMVVVSSGSGSIMLNHVCFRRWKESALK